MGKYWDRFQVTRSDKADECGFDEQYTPPNSVWDKAIFLAVNVLDPIEDYLWSKYRGTFDVSSWYRADRTNTAVGGATNSIHKTGGAVDISYFLPDGTERNDLILEAIVETGVPFTRIVLEYGSIDNPKWIHIAYLEGRNEHKIRRKTSAGYTDKTWQWLIDEYGA